jgi:hypothetical protein
LVVHFWYTIGALEIHFLSCCFSVFFPRFPMALERPSRHGNHRFDNTTIKCIKWGFYWDLTCFWGPIFHWDSKFWSSNFVFVMASPFYHLKGELLYQSKMRQLGSFMLLMSFLMSIHSFLGTYFSWRCRNLKFKIRFCCVVLSWRDSFTMERPSCLMNRKSDNTAVSCLTLAF